MKVNLISALSLWLQMLEFVAFHLVAFKLYMRGQFILFFPINQILKPLQHKNKFLNKLFDSKIQYMSNKI